MKRNDSPRRSFCTCRATLIGPKAFGSDCAKLGNDWGPLARRGYRFPGGVQGGGPGAQGGGPGARGGGPGGPDPFFANEGAALSVNINGAT